MVAAAAAAATVGSLRGRVSRVDSFGIPLLPLLSLSVFFTFCALRTSVFTVLFLVTSGFSPALSSVVAAAAAVLLSFFSIFVAAEETPFPPFVRCFFVVLGVLLEEVKRVVAVVFFCVVFFLFLGVFFWVFFFSFSCFLTFSESAEDIFDSATFSFFEAATVHEKKKKKKKEEEEVDVYIKCKLNDDETLEKVNFSRFLDISRGKKTPKIKREIEEIIYSQISVECYYI